MISIRGSITLSAILILALGLRLWGIRFGLPHLFHPDEWAIVDPAMMMLRTGDFNPDDFHYPTFFIYNEAFVFALRFLYGAARGQFTTINDLPITGMYVWGRIFAALYGTAAVFIIYKAGQRLFDRRVGIVSALFLAVAFLHVRDSHYIAVDIPSTTLATLSFLFACGILTTGAWRYYLLSGLAAGLGTATKWNVAPILVCMLTAHFLSYARKEPIDGRIFSGLGMFVAGLVIGTPYAWKDPMDFFNTVGPVFAHYSVGHEGFEAMSPILYYLNNIASQEGASITIALAALTGLTVSMARHRAKDVFIIIFPVIYLLGFARSPVTFPRTVLPLYPFIALYAGCAVMQFTQWITERFKESRDTQRVLIAGIAALLIAVPSIVRSVQYAQGSTTVSTRTQAGAWIDANIPKEAKLAAEFYAPPVSDDFDIVELAHIDEFPGKWFKAEKFDYIIFDSADYGRYFAEPTRYAKQVAKYNELLTLGKTIKTFPSDPRVELFLSPEIKVLKIDKERKTTDNR